MTRFWKSVLGLFCTCCFCCSAEANDLDPDSHAYLSNVKYAKNIEIKVYLVTRDQLINALADNNFKVVQKKNRDLYCREVFLLVSCKNFGEYPAFGTLNCKLPNTGRPLSLELEMLPGYMKTFYYSAIIRISEGIISNNDDIPIVTCEWKHLYTM